VSRETAHEPNVIVQINWYVPSVSPDTVVFLSAAFAKVAAGPESFVQAPLPASGSLPARVIEFVPEGRHWSMPAADATGPCVDVVVILTWSDEPGPQALFIVQVKVYTVLATSPVTTAFLVLALGENTTPALGLTVQVPVSFSIGALPAR
jgi:hypothetical protein